MNSASPDSDLAAQVTGVTLTNSVIRDVKDDTDTRKATLRNEGYKSYRQLSWKNLLKRFKTRKRKLWKILWLSMSLAFILSFQQVVGYELEKLFTSRFLPTITFIGHGIVAVIYASRMVRYQSDKISWKLMDRLTIYFVISFLEITANLIALYRHSIITNRGSIEVYELSVPIVLVAGFIFLGFRYGVINLLGITVCLLGIRLSPLVIEADYLMRITELWRVTEIFLCLMGSLFLAVSIVFKNFIIKIYGSLELLGVQSVFNCLMTGMIMLIFDIQPLLSMNWTFMKGLLLLSYSVSFALFNILAVVIIELSDSIMLTLCLLPSPLYSNLILKFLEESKVQFSTMISVVIIIIGYCTYMLEPVREGERIRTLSGSEQNHSKVINNNKDLNHRNTKNTRINVGSGSYTKVTSRTPEPIEVSLTEIKML